MVRLVIWDAMAPLWRHCNAQIQLNQDPEDFTLSDTTWTMVFM